MRFDPTSKTLVERHPIDWLNYCGLHPHGPVSVIDSDVSTLTAISDRVIRVDEPTPWLANFELQSGYESTGCLISLINALLESNQNLERVLRAENYSPLNSS